MYRDANVNDAPAISRFVSAIATEYIGPSLSTAGLEMLLARMDVASTRTRIVDGWTHILYTKNEQINGIIVVRPPTHLYHLFVETALQRSGIGRSLFQMANERTRADAGCGLATVNSSINAIEAYTRLGFVSDGPIVEVEGVRFQPMNHTGG